MSFRSRTLRRISLVLPAAEPFVRHRRHRRTGRTDQFESGVDYQLYLNGVTPIGAPVVGTGSSISFGNQNRCWNVFCYRIISGRELYPDNVGQSASITSVPGTLYYADAGWRRLWQPAGYTALLYASVRLCGECAGLQRQ